MYDFDENVDRHHTNSMKWGHPNRFLTNEQCAADPLPMWVADMDFRIAQPIRKALLEQVEMGVLGYGGTPDSYLEAATDWQERRFGWKVQPEWLIQSPGVISALNMANQAFSHPGDHVLVQPPVYFHFLHDVVANGRQLALAPLTLDADRYRYDPEAFEAVIVPGTRLFILCNPHNPTGSVWTREELTSIAAICERHNILIISDEVHQDLVLSKDRRHIPMAMLDETIAQNTITCTSPSKTFNIAGLSCANIYIPNTRHRQRYWQQCERNGAFLVNTMGTAACEAAYRHGEPWVEAMLEYVRSNRQHFVEQVTALGLPITVTPSDALYLAWLDFRQPGIPAAKLHDFLLRHSRLWLDPGHKFGTAGEGFMRINLACPRNRIDEALSRLASTLT